MYAYELQEVLALLLQKSDYGGPSREEMAERFASLRSYGRLPMGKDNRGVRLNLEHLASAIMGLVPKSGNWAGHSATCLRNLIPIGGAQAAPEGCSSLQLLLQRLLDDEELRGRLVNLSMSGAEVGTNSNGSAIATFQNEQRSHVSFVSELSYSTQSPGAELAHDYETRFAPSSRELSLNREFFEEVAREYLLSGTLGRPPKPDAGEYDAEEVLKAHYRALGARPNSRFLNVGIETSVSWPKAACRFPFGAGFLVALPSSRNTEASLHIDLTAHRMSDVDGRSLLNEAMSIAVWLDDRMGMVLDGWSGNPFPQAVPRSTQRFPTSIIDAWCNTWSRVDDERVRVLLGLYREARNLEQTHSIPYALLGYFRIFESIWPNANLRTSGLAEHLEEALSSKLISSWELEQTGLQEEMSGASLGQAIYRRRLQVAHAKAPPFVNPDVSDDIRRLSALTGIARCAARLSMIKQMGITDNRWAADWRHSQ